MLNQSVTDLMSFGGDRNNRENAGNTSIMDLMGGGGASGRGDRSMQLNTSQVGDFNRSRIMNRSRMHGIGKHSNMEKSFVTS